MADWLKYDPLWDSGVRGKDKEFWERQIKRGATERQLPNQGEQPVTNRMDINNLPTGYRVVKRKELEQRKQLLRKVYRSDES